MSHSLLEAIKKGNWEFEPAGQDATEVPPTPAMPGSKEKLAILAERAAARPPPLARFRPPHL